MPSITFEVDPENISPDVAPLNPTMSVWLPINEEIAEMLTIDDNVHVQFDAQVIGIDNDGHGVETDNYTMRVKIQRVKVSLENEFEEMAREDEADEMAEAEFSEFEVG